ncbi:hypothetical protein [Kingella oralis]|uniref:hypothetical protein n=1 Tax=Kingella oralis TaxID=505 RepID=UPI0034E5B232
MRDRFSVLQVVCQFFGLGCFSGCLRRGAIGDGLRQPENGNGRFGFAETYFVRFQAA